MRLFDFWLLFRFNSLILNENIVFMKKTVITILSLVFFISSCNEAAETTTTTESAKPLLASAPVFSGTNAYDLVAKQVAFGPRNPNSEGHIAMGNWLVDTLKLYADTVYVQTADLKAFNGDILKSKNVIASFNPESKKRMFVAAHWDTRPFADQDFEKTDEPILGANDGASGVAVLLELARILKETPVDQGIDLIFFDSEDYGQPANSDYPYMEDSYCLGSQYWSKNPHVLGYSAQFGVLLDMVGAKNAVFTQEGFSVQYANNYLQKVWNYAHAIGYSKYFSFNKTSPITDDHYFINKIARIPTIDILQHDKNTRSGFGSYWHTHQDDMEIIDPQTLKAVGQTVTQVIYQFNQGNF